MVKCRYFSLALGRRSIDGDISAGRADNGRAVLGWGRGGAVVNTRAGAIKITP